MLPAVFAAAVLAASLAAHLTVPAMAFGLSPMAAPTEPPRIETRKAQFFWPFRPQQSYRPPARERAPARQQQQQRQQQAPAPQPSGEDGALVGEVSEAENATRVVVFGDSLGKLLWEGLGNSLGSEDEAFSVLRKTKASSGIVRDDFYDWQKAVEATLEEGRVDVAVWMVGINDLQQIRGEGNRHEPNSPEWTEIYKTRIDNLIKALQSKGAAVYWVGLPIVRSDRLTRGYAQINDILRERTELQGARFIDIWDGFADENGAYSAYGPDVSGTRRKLRRGNGIHFTDAGTQKLVHFVEREIRKDLAVAGVNLDGRRVIQQGQRGGLVISGPGGNGAEGELAGANDPSVALADPMVPRTIVPNASPGQPMMLNGPSTAEGKTDGEEVFSPLFTVLMRGDPLPPKSGRADDFRWDGETARR